MKKNAIVTGGSSGIGHSIALKLIDSGFNVFIFSRRPPSDWDQDMPNCWNAETNWVEIDFTSTQKLDTTIKKWLNTYGDNLSVLVHSAIDYGSNSRRSISNVTIEDWERVFKVNVESLFILFQNLVPQMAKNGEGLIIPISSEVAYNSGAGRTDYAASKSAAKSLVQSLIDEARRLPIQIVSLLPEGMVNTPGIQKRRQKGDPILNEYAKPSSFQPAVENILSDMGRRHHGNVYSVNIYGEMNNVEGQYLVSNTTSSDIGALHNEP
ncbi:SDR family oxidoreductase [Vibrio paucivorans]|uniref:SDR family oxidoreductase n=1 Tax=Vibrio paucivorans TaxID=2829489 RepID=A0A9X3HSL5_9VIBR|nr:SDR family oxidoreductase [Vibrio paucivorans]MCW8334901.1 SDR family oxidoreductase [Vibrio paucivorans]